MKDASQDIYSNKVGAVDRSLALAASQGFAGSLTKGLADSTQAADTRDNVARRFSDVYSNLDADSRTQGMALINNLSNLQGSQRSAAMTELISSLNPELQARIATFRPDNTAVIVAGNNAALDSQKLGTILQALGISNGQIIGDARSGATAIATNASRNLQAAMNGLGQTRSNAVVALSPAVQALLAGVAGGATASGSGSTGSNLFAQLVSKSGGSIDGSGLTIDRSGLGIGQIGESQLTPQSP